VLHSLHDPRSDPIRRCTRRRVPTRRSPAQPLACDVSTADRAWIKRALDAWRLTAREITHLDLSRRFKAVFFDSSCVLTSDTALSSSNAAGIVWSAAPHTGEIVIPNGSRIPSGVISFSGAGNDSPYFVMSTPSIWRMANVPARQMDLETLMVFVLIHEGSHVAQSPTYGAQIGPIAVEAGLPEGFNDDSMQEVFGSNPAFVDSIRRETDLLFRAAAAEDVSEARSLAREARALMRARAGRWFVGEQDHFNGIEPLFLTFEAAGQWAGYKWLTHPRGGGVADTAALRESMRGNWWSQNQGLGIALTLDRLGVEWSNEAFGPGRLNVVQMLDAALE
jgi:hypothetical protein